MCKCQEQSSSLSPEPKCTNTGAENVTHTTKELLYHRACKSLCKRPMTASVMVWKSHHSSVVTLCTNPGLWITVGTLVLPLALATVLMVGRWTRDDWGWQHLADQTSLLVEKSSYKGWQCTLGASWAIQKCLLSCVPWGLYLDTSLLSKSCSIRFCKRWESTAWSPLCHGTRQRSLCPCMVVPAKPWAALCLCSRAVGWGPPSPSPLQAGTGGEKCFLLADQQRLWLQSHWCWGFLLVFSANPTDWSNTFLQIILYEFPIASALFLYW